MPTRTPPVCTHLRGPGTTVCLRCRQEEREGAQGRLQRSMLRGGAVVLVLAVVAVGIAASARALQRRGSEEPSETEGVATSTATSMVSPADSGVTSPAPAPAVTGPAPMITPPPPLVPSFTGAQLQLENGMFATRAGDTVVVHFDTEQQRTRRADKFDLIVRSTLPRVYGAGAAAVLAGSATPIAPGSELVATLPEVGVRLPVGDGWRLTIWPMTREGRDGPLVIAYRVVVSR